MKNIWIVFLIIIIVLGGITSLMIVGGLKDSVIRYIFLAVSIPTVVFPSVRYWINYFNKLFKATL